MNTRNHMYPRPARRAKVIPDAPICYLPCCTALSLTWQQENNVDILAHAMPSTPAENALMNVLDTFCGCETPPAAPVKNTTKIVRPSRRACWTNRVMLTDAGVLQANAALAVRCPECYTLLDAYGVCEACLQAEVEEADLPIHALEAAMRAVVNNLRPDRSFLPAAA